MTTIFERINTNTLTIEEIQKVFTAKNIPTEIITTQFGYKFVFITLDKVTVEDVFVAMIDGKIANRAETKHLGNTIIAVYVSGSKV